MKYCKSSVTCVVGVITLTLGRFWLNILYSNLPRGCSCTGYASWAPNHRDVKRAAEARNQAEPSLSTVSVFLNPAIDYRQLNLSFGIKIAGRKALDAWQASGCVHCTLTNVAVKLIFWSKISLNFITLIQFFCLIPQSSWMRVIAWKPCWQPHKKKAMWALSAS